MSISLSTLTNPATSDSVLLEAQSEADFLEPIVLFKNRATGSNAISNDATQTTANDQPLSLPLIDGDGYLYQPDVTGNAPAVNIPSISANEDFVFEMEVYLVDAASFHLASGADSNHRFAVYGGSFYFAPENRTLSSPLSTGACTLTVERSGTTATFKQDGVTKATITGVSSLYYNLTHLCFNGQHSTSIGKLNGYIKTATLSIEGTEVFNCDFTDTSIADGASSFDCSTGQTVTINTGSGVDQARIVRRPKAVFNDSKMNFVHTNVGDAFFVCATESGVVSGVFDTSSQRNKFSGNGALKNSYRTDFLQTVWGMWPNTISDSQKQSLVDYAKSKSAGKNWAGIENFRFFFRSSNLKSLDASYWDTGSATNFSYFLRGANTIESLDIRGWDTSSVVIMNDFARGCTSLTNILIDGNTLSDSACTNYGHAFTDTNLNQATIDDILVRINAAGTSNGTFDRTGGEYPSVTGVAAKDALQARGWSMTFSSEVLPSVLDLEPAAAYSLRSFDSDADPNVVRVRRSSDGALSNFKASEVSDGTLTTWVNNVITISPTLNNGGFEDGATGYIFGSNASLDTTVSKSGSNSAKLNVVGGAYTYLGKQNAPIEVGQQVKVSFWAKSSVADGSNRFRLVLGSTNNQFTPSSTNWELYEVTQTVYSTTEMTFARVGAGDFTIHIDDITVTNLTADGQVNTWYDQGGSNDASQTLVSKMPLLVDGGTLVTEGGLPALDFDGVGDHFDFASSIITKALFCVTSPVQSVNDDLILSNGAGGSSGSHFGFNDGVNLREYPDYSPGYTHGLSANEQNLVSATILSGNKDYYVNSSTVGASSGTALPSYNNIGIPSGLQNFEGNAQEIVIYDTDQSANRTAIETNIMDHFDIT